MRDVIVRAATAVSGTARLLRLARGALAADTGVRGGADLVELQGGSLISMLAAARLRAGRGVLQARIRHPIPAGSSARSEMTNILQTADW